MEYPLCQRSCGGRLEKNEDDYFDFPTFFVSLFFFIISFLINIFMVLLLVKIIFICIFFFIGSCFFCTSFYPDTANWKHCSRK